MHTFAHYFNWNTYSNASPQKINNLFKTTTVPNQWGLAFATVPGVTGHIASLCMILMYSSAKRYVRGPSFNIFWFAHHLFILFYLSLCIHGAQALLEFPTFWAWTIIPLAMYTFERIIRELRGRKNTILELAVAHPNKVLELRMLQTTFEYKPGQYLFLLCPKLSQLEWHPFTITSAPEEPGKYISVHIRALGDWTGALHKFLNPDRKLGVVQENIRTAQNGKPILKIDGPFGASSQEVFNFEVVMLIGAGIGVTPFASILKSVLYTLLGSGQLKLRKVYFYWISRDLAAFEWFYDLLIELEKNNVNEFLDIRIFLTSNGMSLEEKTKASEATGLATPINFGRPNWPNLFAETGVTHEGEKVGVFLCGPAILAQQIKSQCRKYTSTKVGTKFVFHKENF